MSTIGRTSVVKVRGRFRAELLADPAFLYVGRRVAWTKWTASVWGNPFRVGMDPSQAMRILDNMPHLVSSRIEFDGPLTPAKAIECFACGLTTDATLSRRLPEFQGKHLGCWCCDWDGGERLPEIPCHAVALALMADGRIDHLFRYLRDLERIPA